MNSSTEAVDAEGEGGTSSSWVSPCAGLSSSTELPGAIAMSSSAWDSQSRVGFNLDKAIFMFLISTISASIFSFRSSSLAEPLEDELVLREQ